jgi:carboxylesterase type B
MVYRALCSDLPQLTCSVIRPSGYNHKSLPVLVWIYGGGLTLGSTADPQYNLSGIVEASTLTDNPFIAVSMNYRLGVWGFLNTPVVRAEGSSNAGLLDQRLALQWVKENILAFGGDPTRVTIWGESAVRTFVPATQICRIMLIMTSL